MDRRWRGPLTVAARVAATTLAVVLVTSTATGLLYWVRSGVAHWPGPHVTDALPLDELPGHDSVPLTIYIAAFGIASVALGLLARALRLDRLSAGLSLAAGVGIWLFLADAFCLFVVRQVSAAQAFRAAAGLQPVYLSAAMAGAGGALLGRSTPADRLAHRLLAWLVAAAALIDLVASLFPRPWSAIGLVERLGPSIVSPAAHVLLILTGVLLLIGSRGLARRSRPAWGLSAALLGLSALLHLIRGPDYAAAIVTGLITVALVARRQDFSFHGDPTAEPSALLRLIGMLLLAVCYGIAALWTYRTVSDLPFSLYSALRDTLRALVGLPPSGGQYLPRGFSGWFPLSVALIAAIGLIWAAEVWVRPWRQRFFPDSGRRERAAQIVRRWGEDTLAPFTLRSDKEWFFSGQTLIAYRVIRSIALVSGDPVGPPQDAGPALDAFLAHARARGWHVAILGASDRFLRVYRERALHPLYHGDEAVVDTAGFSLEGRPMRTVRQAVSRLARHGYSTQVVMADEVPPVLRAELTAIDQAWLRHGVRKGFTMELDDVLRLGGHDAMFVVGRDDQGRVAGYLHLAVCPSSRSLSLSSMPRRSETPNGFNAWLIANAVSWASINGFVRVSLNFSPFAGLLAAGAALSSSQRLERRALLKLKDLLDLQLDNLLRFNRQFCPGWLARYVVVEYWADLPRVAVAAMAAEGYLPHAGLIRGPGWQPAAEPAADEPADEPPPAEPPTAEPPPAEPAAAEPAAGRR